MQQVEKTLGISVKDFQELAPKVQSAFDTAKAQYLAATHPKLRLLDNVIGLCIATFLIQVVYGVVFNRDPFNSFIAGVFCSLGLFAMTASLRVQLTNPDAFESLATKRMVFEYIIGSLLVFFASLLLMG